MRKAPALSAKLVALGLALGAQQLRQHARAALSKPVELLLRQQVLDDDCRGQRRPRVR